MSVSTNQTRDTSTENANWGTLVVLLVLAFVALFIGVALYSDSQKPTPPMTLSVPASATVPVPAQGATVPAPAQGATAPAPAQGATVPAAAGSPAGTDSASHSAPVPSGAGGGQ